MATTTTSSDSTTEGTEETSEGQSTEEQSTGETSGQDDSQGQSQDDQSSSTEQKPDTSSSKPDPAKQALLADLNKERKDLKASRARVTELEAQVADLSPKAETVDALQAKYDRLEGFLQEVGGPLGKALDSRTFTRDLFETDRDIKEIVKDWRQANPTATSAALGAGAAEPAGKAPNMNDILRAAVK